MLSIKFKSWCRKLESCIENTKCLAWILKVDVEIWKCNLKYKTWILAGIVRHKKAMPVQKGQNTKISKLSRYTNTYQDT